MEYILEEHTEEAIGRITYNSLHKEFFSKCDFIVYTNKFLNARVSVIGLL